MITAIEIENFKGIRERVRLELRPLTLLFGPNSAGKSTILHALHYAREVFERHNLNADQTAIGGRFVNLGGFRNFVHDRDLSRPVVLRFELDLSDDIDIPAYSGVGPHYAKIHLEEGALPRLGESMRTAGIEVEIAWSVWRKASYVRRYTVAINGAHLASIRSEPDRPEVYLTDIEQNHPVFQRSEEGSVLEDVLGDFNGVVHSGTRFPIGHQQDALPRWGEALEVDARPDDDWRLLPDSAISLAPIAPGTERFVALFSHLMVGPAEWLRWVLRSFHYLGPFREQPEKHHAPPPLPDPSRWANGRAAWDRLHADPDLVQRANRWLSGPDSLEVGYSFQHQHVKEIPLESPLMVLLRSDRAFDDLEDIRTMIDRFPTRTSLVLIADETRIEMHPHDVGVGVSQIVPVVVLALDQQIAFAAIEQPELHVHPAVQVRLGDLFLQQLKTMPGRQLLLETHSEHLILRIMRRIRETSEGTPHNGIPVTGEDVAVCYISIDKDHTALRRIDIDRKGDFVQPWPDDFFEIDFYERFGHAG